MIIRCEILKKKRPCVREIRDEKLHAPEDVRRDKRKNALCRQRRVSLKNAEIYVS